MCYCLEIQFGKRICPIPLLREMFHKLKERVKVSKLGIADSCLLIGLQDFRNFLVILDYSNKRLLFGLSSASALFQKVIDQTAADLPMKISK